MGLIEVPHQDTAAESRNRAGGYCPSRDAAGGDQGQDIQDGGRAIRPSPLTQSRHPVHPLVVGSALHTAWTSPAHFPSGDGHPRPTQGSFANHRNLDPRMSTPSIRATFDPHARPVGDSGALGVCDSIETLRRYPFAKPKMRSVFCHLSDEGCLVVTLSVHRCA